MYFCECVTECANGFIKTFTKFFHKDLVSKFGCGRLIGHGMSHPAFCRGAVNGARKFGQGPHGLRIHLHGYRRGIVLGSLDMVFVGAGVDFLVGGLVRN